MNTIFRRLAAISLLAMILAGCGPSPPARFNNTIKQTFFHPCGPNNWISDLTWSPDSSRIAYIEGLNSNRIRIIDITSTVIVSSSDLPHSPPDLMWSPDGSQLIFTMNEDGPYLMNADGTAVRPLFADGDLQASAGNQYAWSPHSTLLTVNIIDPNEAYAIALVDPARGQVINKYLLEDWVGLFSWSADGELLGYFVRQPSAPVTYDYKLVVTRLESTSVQTLVTGIDPRNRPAMWSPDGSRLAFVDYEDNLQTMHIMGLDRSDDVTFSDAPIIQIEHWIDDESDSHKKWGGHRGRPYEVTTGY